MDSVRAEAVDRGQFPLLLFVTAWSAGAHGYQCEWEELENSMYQHYRTQSELAEPAAIRKDAEAGDVGN
jgi:hypothetical protein